jgi:hypothetical protein
LNKNSIPIQRSKSDYAFLHECAGRWGCVWWVDFNDVTGFYTLYFYDDVYAFSKGNTIHKINLEDFQMIYQLGYRTDIDRNNVEK